MADRKVSDKKYNEKRNDERIQLVFNINNKDDAELYKKFVALQNKYGASKIQTLKNLIADKDIDSIK